MRRTFLTLILALALVGTGCSGVRGNLVETGIADGSAETAYPNLAPAESTGSADDSIATGDTASAEPFAFTAPDLFTGTTVTGLELYQEAPMIVSFVSPTCPVCVTEGPEIAFAADMHPDVTYLLIHSGADSESYRHYAETAGLYQENVIHVEDGSGVIWQRFNIVSTPSTLMVDVDGRVSQSTGALELQGHAKAADLVLGVAAG